MTLAQSQEQLEEQLRRRNNVLGALLRMAIIAMAWLVIAVPKEPSWVVSESYLTHLVFGVTMLIAAGALLNFYFDWLVSTTSYLTTLGTDMLGICALVYVTGGVKSPFLLLFLVAILGVFFLGNFKQGVIAAAAGFGYAVILVVLLVTGVLPSFEPFSQELNGSETAVLQGLSLTLLGLFVLFAVVLHALTNRRLARLEERLREKEADVRQAGRELLAGFHDMESLADRNREQQAQTEQARSLLIRAERMASIGQLSLGYLHQLNGPLTAILTDVEMLSLGRDEKPPEPVLATYERLDENANRMRSLVTALAQSAGAGTRNLFESVDLNRLVRRVLKLVGAEISKRSIHLITELDQNLPRVMAVRIHIEQVILNLLSNALTATSTGRGRLIVSTYVEDGRVLISIGDNGPGIPPDRTQKVFEPFFSTWPVGGGLGLGLFVVKEIAENHGGEVQVSSAPGSGTTFTVFLPIPGDKKGSDSLAIS
jgi:signal transduction histidine kinase